MFKKIGEAYACLSKPEQREIYDKYGKEGLQQGFNPNPGPKFNNFGNNFGGFNDFRNFDKNFEKNFFEKPGFGFGFNNFTFERAEQIFKDFFSNESFFSDEYDDFFNNGNKKKSNVNYNSKSKNKNIMGGFEFFEDDDPFANDPFFSIGMKKDFFKMNSEFSNFTSGPQMASKSFSQSTIIKNGKKVSVTKTSVRNSDGTVHTEVHEKIHDGGNNYKENKYIDMPKKQNTISKNSGNMNYKPAYGKSKSTKYN